MKKLLLFLALICGASAQTPIADLQVGRTLKLGALAAGTVTPAQITSNQNNYAPTGYATALRLRISSDAARTITGLSAGTGAGGMVILVNVGSFTITLAAENASSTAANRFSLAGGDYSLGANGAAVLEYDATATRWRLLGSSISTLGGAGTVTNTGGSLTANALLLGAGGADSKVAAGLATDGTSKLILGVAGTSAGGIDFKNATSGTITLAPVTGALGTVTLSLPAATDTLVGRTTTDTLTNKTLTAPSIAGGTHTALTSLGIRSTGTGAFDLTLANTENLTAGRTLTITTNDAARTLNLGGNLTTAAAFTTSGANALTLTTTASTNVTLPTTGTLATLAGTEALSNKTITSSSIAATTLSATGSVTLGTNTTSTSLDGYNGAASAAPGYRFNGNKSRSGGVITAGDQLFAIYGYGHDGTGYIEGGKLLLTNIGTVATNRIGAQWQFYAHPDSTSANALVATLDSTGLAVTGTGSFTGNVGIGGSSATNWGLQVSNNMTVNSTNVGLGFAGTFTPPANGLVLEGVRVSGAIATGTFTGLDYRGIDLSTPSVTGTGTIAQASQIYIGGAPTATAKYGIYQAGTDQNLLGGSLLMSSSLGSGEIRLQQLPGTPYTQAALTIYRDASNWGYLNYGSDANLRIIYGKSGAGILYIGTSTAIDNTGTFNSVMQVSTAGFGYSSGMGGTVTQATSRTTGVTLNKVCGTITLFTTTLAADTTQSFTFTNSAIAAGDQVVCQHTSGGTVGSYSITASATAAGSCTINVRNITPSTTASEAPVITFVVIKAVTA